jgi:hypothetical protein
MDLMEVAPAYDQAEVTALAGATLVLEMLYGIASRKEPAVDQRTSDGACRGIDNSRKHRV